MSRCGSCSAWAILFEPRRWNGQPQTRGRQVGPCGAARSGHGDSVVNDPDSRRLSVTVACERSRVNGTRDHARVHRGRDPPRAPAARSAARCGSARPWRRRLRAAGAAFQAPKPSADPPRRRPGRFPVSRAPGRLMDGPDEDSWSSHDSISVQRGRLMIPTPPHVPPGSTHTCAERHRASPGAVFVCIIYIYATFSELWFSETTTPGLYIPLQKLSIFSPTLTVYGVGPSVYLYRCTRLPVALSKRNSSRGVSRGCQKHCVQHTCTPKCENVHSIE